MVDCRLIKEEAIQISAESMMSENGSNVCIYLSIDEILFRLTGFKTRQNLTANQTLLELCSCVNQGMNCCLCHKF